jgi:lambda family phage portal protein
VSCFAPAVLIAHDTGDLIGSELDAAKMASKWLAFVKRAGGYPVPDSPGIGIDPETNKPIEELENATLEYLRAGEEIEIASAKRPGDSFEPFIRLLLRLVAITVGCSYEGLSGDYAGVDYSGLRALKNDDAQKARPWQTRHIRQFCDVGFKSFMDMAVLSGGLDLPGYFRDPSRYLARTWFPPYPEAVDALKEGKADIALAKAGLISPQELARRRQRDIQDIYTEIADAKEAAEALGLSFETVKTPSASNPAALEEQDGQK